MCVSKSRVEIPGSLTETDSIDGDTTFGPFLA